MYGSGNISGSLSRDTVSIGGVTVPDLLFAEASAEGKSFLNFAEDGVLGLAFPGLSSPSSGGDAAYTEQLRAKLPTVRRVFTFCLTDESEGEDGEG